MDEGNKQNELDTYNGTLFSLENTGNSDIHYKMKETGQYYTVKMSLSQKDKYGRIFVAGRLIQIHRKKEKQWLPGATAEGNREAVKLLLNVSNPLFSMEITQWPRGQKIISKERGKAKSHLAMHKAQIKFMH